MCRGTLLCRNDLPAPQRAALNTIVLPGTPREARSRPAARATLGSHFRLAATPGRTRLIPARSVREVSKTPLSSLTYVISSPFPRLRLAHT